MPPLDLNLGSTGSHSSIICHASTPLSNHNSFLLPVPRWTPIFILDWTYFHIHSMFRSAPWYQTVSGPWSLLSHPIEKMPSFHVPTVHSLAEPLSWAQSPKGVMRHAWGRQEDAGTPGKPPYLLLEYLRGLLLLPGFLSGKEFAWQCEWRGLEPWWWRSPGEGNGNPLQHSCLENSMDRGTERATVRGVAKESDTT